MKPQSSLYGLLAEFESPEGLLSAARRAREAGFSRMDAFSPFPVHGITEALGFGGTGIPWLVLIGGAAGALGGFALQYFSAVIDYPINVGGRPLNSWPMFIIICFELTILAAGLTAVLGMLALNKLPQPHHPLFEVPRFALASRDHFFLLIEANDPRFDLEQTRRFLEEHGATEVNVVPAIPHPQRQEA